jgi:predicted dehydrogenase
MKVAVLGAGGMGATVIEHLQECEDVSEIIAQDVRAERVTELKAKYNIEATTDLDAVLRDPQVLCAFVTSSNDAHAELAIDAMKAGKAVLCEKPMATNLDDARAMVECAEATGSFLQIGFELRYSRLYSSVKKWIDDGLLGEIVNTQCTYIASAWKKNTWRAAGIGGGMFGEKLSHYVDLPRWWIGAPVEEIYAASAPNAIPYYQLRDNYQATYRFRNGAISHLTFMMAPAATFNGDPLQDTIDQQQGDGHTLRYLVQGTRGAAETDVFARTLKRWEFGDTPDTFISKLVETVTWDKSEDHFWYHNTCNQTHDVVRRVKDGLPPSTPARDALETMRLCFAAEISADEKRVVRLDEIGA